MSEPPLLIIMSCPPHNDVFGTLQYQHLPSVIMRGGVDGGEVDGHNHDNIGLLYK